MGEGCRRAGPGPQRFLPLRYPRTAIGPRRADDLSSAHSPSRRAETLGLAERRPWRQAPQLLPLAHLPLWRRATLARFARLRFPGHPPTRRGQQSYLRDALALERFLRG